MSILQVPLGWGKSLFVRKMTEKRKGVSNKNGMEFSLDFRSDLCFQVDVGGGQRSFRLCRCCGEQLGTGLGSCNLGRRSVYVVVLGNEQRRLIQFLRHPSNLPHCRLVMGPVV